MIQFVSLCSMSHRFVTLQISLKVLEQTLGSGLLCLIDLVVSVHVSFLTGRRVLVGQ